MKNESGVTYTRDFYLACVIKTMGIPLTTLERGDGKFVVFVFDDPGYEAQGVVQDYWNHLVSVDAKQLIDTISELKTRLHSGEGRT